MVCLKCGDILDDDAAFDEHTDKHRQVLPFQPEFNFIQNMHIISIMIDADQMIVCM